MSSMEQIGLYSCYPANCTFALAMQVREQIAAEDRRDFVCRRRGEPRPAPTGLTSRDLYPALPWTMADLPGTTWRNAYTHRATTIEKICTNRDGKLGPDPDPLLNVLFEIGLWWGDRFVIGGWVRVDHLDATAQMDWHLGEVAHSVSEHHRAVQSLLKKEKERRGRDSCYGGNLRLRQADVECTGETREMAICLARTFADEHGIAFTVDTLNRIVIEQSQTAQLALF